MNRCPRCHADLSRHERPEGLCPKCLLAVALGEPDVLRTGSGRPLPPPPDPALLAPHFPQLEILEVVGRGGMGVVYRARQRELDRVVALKVLDVHSDDPSFAERFVREARAMGGLAHPNIAAVYDSGRAGEHYYLILEYVDGPNLRQLITTHRPTASEALKIVGEICDALEYAHGEGVVHRDIKPENVLLDVKGRVKIVDFGLAKLLGRAEDELHLTRSHQALGTWHYMAPEQVERPLEVDHRADIYSLGVVFYELLTGELPLGRFEAPSRRVAIDVRLDEIVLKTLEKDRERRYQRAGAVREDVEHVSSSDASRAGRRSRAEERLREHRRRRRERRHARHARWEGLARSLKNEVLGSVEVVVDAADEASHAVDAALERAGVRPRKAATADKGESGTRVLVIGGGLSMRWLVPLLVIALAIAFALRHEGLRERAASLFTQHEARSVEAPVAGLDVRPWPLDEVGLAGASPLAVDVVAAAWEEYVALERAHTTIHDPPPYAGDAIQVRIAPFSEERERLVERMRARLAAAVGREPALRLLAGLHLTRLFPYCDRNRVIEYQLRSAGYAVRFGSDEPVTALEIHPCLPWPLARFERVLGERIDVQEAMPLRELGLVLADVPELADIAMELRERYLALEGLHTTVHGTPLGGRGPMIEIEGFDNERDELVTELQRRVRDAALARLGDVEPRAIQALWNGIDVDALFPFGARPAWIHLRREGGLWFALILGPGGARWLEAPELPWDLEHLARSLGPPR